MKTKIACALVIIAGILAAFGILVFGCDYECYNWEPMFKSFGTALVLLAIAWRLTK